MTRATSIEHVHGRRVFDSRGRPTVEAEVRLQGGAVGRAIAPAGASKGSAEAVDQLALDAEFANASPARVM